MQRASILTLAAAIALSTGLAFAAPQADTIAVGGRVMKPGRYERVENESLAALINRVGGIPVTQSGLDQYQRGELVSRVRIFLSRGGKKKELPIDPKSNDLWQITVEKNDIIEIARAELSDSEKFPATLILKKPKSGQAPTPKEP